MYQLEERILFDGAAVVAVAAANQQAHDAGKDAAQNKQNHDQNNQNNNQNQNQDQQSHPTNPHTQNHNDITKPDSDGITRQHTGVDQLIAQALNLDHSVMPANSGDHAEQHVNVMVISTSLDNADAVASLADANTIVVKYDSHNTTSAQLLAQINESLHGKKADSIAFLSEAGDGQLSLFKDGKTTVTSLNDSVQQQFWQGVGGMLDSSGRVDFLASSLAATDAGKSLVSEIAQITGHETAASTDLTGSAEKGGNWTLEYAAGGKDTHAVDLTEAYLNRNILDSFTSVIPADTLHHEVAFIDSSVMSPEEIANAIKSQGENVEIIMLNKGDAFAQITEYLQDKSNIDAIHIISHGSDGLFSLGDTVVDSKFVEAHQAELAAWGKSLTADGDIMLYGCDVAADADGKTFVQQLAHATGADIAASADSTGAKGNWNLEYSAGHINTAAITVDSYQYSLTDYVVSSPNDSGGGTLRAALASAGSGDQIVFTLNSGSKITLTSELSITQQNLTINGLLSDGVGCVTVSGNNGSRIFNITGSAFISNMTLINGFSATDGGAVYVAQDAAAVFNNVVFDHNAATGSGGAVYVDGQAPVAVSGIYGVYSKPGYAEFNNVTFTTNTAANGGAIANLGDVLINRSTIGDVTLLLAGNTAATSGGAIYNLGRAQIADSNIAGNHATSGNGGGIYNGGVYNDGTNLNPVLATLSVENSAIFGNTASTGGGGIYEISGQTYIENSTIAGNHASSGNGGGIYQGGGNMTISGATIAYNTATTYHGYYISDNSGLLNNTPTLMIDNSIIAYNSAVANTAPYQDFYNAPGTPGTVISAGHNLTGTSNFAFSGTGDQTQSYPGTAIFAETTPADHGGWSYTLALNNNAGNLALNSGSNDGPSMYDQRGYRINGARDIGAYELNGGVARNTYNGLYYTTIQAAVNAASDSQITEIELVGTRILNNSDITVNYALAIKGMGSDKTVIDFNKSHSMTVSDGLVTLLSVSMSDLAVKNGRAVNGGAINNLENLVLNRVELYDNRATVSGGAIYNAVGAMVMADRVNLYRNTAAADGGAVANYGDISLNNSNIYGNSAVTRGGAIASFDNGSQAVDLTVTNSAIFLNALSGGASLGGGIYAESNFELTNTTIAYNTAFAGGGVYTFGAGTRNMTNVTVAYNTTGSAASGGIDINGSGSHLFVNVLSSNNSIANAATSTGATGNNLAWNCQFNTGAYFATGGMGDHGGWSYTLATANGASIINAGTNSGALSYDQRGYDTNGTRDIGAFEYDGYVAYVHGKTAGTLNKLIGQTTIQAAANFYKYYDVTIDNVNTVTLVNTRILENNINVNAWRNASGSNFEVGRTIYIEGSRFGGTVISAGNLGRVMNVSGTMSSAPGSTSEVVGTVYLSNLTLADGFSTSTNVGSGALKINHATVKSSNVTFKDNFTMGSGGAVSLVKGTGNTVNFTAEQSLFANNIALGDGGAIYNLASSGPAITASTFADNLSFGAGGAIANYTSITLANSTVSYNFSMAAGGGIYNGVSGSDKGALSATSDLLAKNRSTESYVIANNISNVATYYCLGYDYNLSDLTSTGATLSDGGHNLVEYQNGVWIDVANKPAVIVNLPVGRSGNFFQFTGANLSGADVYAWNKVTNVYNITGPQSNIFETGKLQDHGGWNYTIALSHNSVALDKGSGQLDDQRGYGYNLARDIGAYERVGIVATNNGTGEKYATIQEAINNAVSGQTIKLVNSRIMESNILVDCSITIEGVLEYGAGADETVNETMIDADYNGRVLLNKSTSANWNLNYMVLNRGLVFQNGGGVGDQAAGNGGAIFTAAALSMTGVTVRASFAQVSGGGVYSVNNLTIAGGDNTTFATPGFMGNSAGLSGGAVFINNTNGTFGFSASDITFRHNSAKFGGAAYLIGTMDNGITPSFSSVTFYGNRANRGGSLNIDNPAGQVSIHGGTFKYDSASDVGGSIFIQSDQTVLLQNLRIDNAFAFNDGGAIYFDGLSSTTSTLEIYDTTAGATPVDSYYAENYALTGNGGAIYMTNAGLLHIHGTTGNPLTDVSFYSNATIGANLSVGNTVKGGAIYFDGIAKGTSNILIENYVYFGYNNSYVTIGNNDGGAIYMENAGTLTAYFSVTFNHNGEDYTSTLTRHGGAVYAINTGAVSFTTAIEFDANSAQLSGSAVYLENTGNVTFGYVEAAFNNQYISSNSAAFYIKNAGDAAAVGGAAISFSDFDAYKNSAGVLYIVNDANASVTIATSSFYNNNYMNNANIQGGGIYVDKASMTVTNSTFAYNDSDGAIYMGAGSLTLNYTTFAYNDATAGAYAVHIAGSTASTLTINNSIIWHNATAPTLSVIKMDANSTFNKGVNNLYQYFDQISINGSNPVAGALSVITAYGSLSTAAVLESGTNNIIGNDDIVTRAFINANTWLSTDMRYHANYLTHALALESVNSIAYRYIKAGVETRAGSADPGTVATDQRGNSRKGFHFDTATNLWVENASGSSIGAFEPLFYMTVNDKGDLTYDPFRTIFSGPAENTSFKVAAAAGSINLREASYWIDNFDTANDPFDPNRYVKFSAATFTTTAGSNNTINLNASAGALQIRTDQIIGMINGYAGLEGFVADNSYMAQDSSARITLNAGGVKRVVTITAKSESNGFTWSSHAGLNNLTLTNGYTDGGNKYESDYGSGGGINIISGNALIINNVVVSNSTASNANFPSTSDASSEGLGGGIYNSGTLTVNDSTITGNTATGTRVKVTTDFVALGGGIYNNGGDITISRSLIAGNLASGFGYSPGAPTYDPVKTSGTGGGLYNDGGTMTVISSTVSGNTTAHSGGDSAMYDGAAITVRVGTISLYNSTVARNIIEPADGSGSAVYRLGGTLNIRSSILADNFINGSFQHRRDINANNIGVLAQDSYNIIGWYTGFTPAVTDKTSLQDDGKVTNLNLDTTLKYNGGKTMNYRLMSGSVAFGFADPGLLPAGNDYSDQRGINRAQMAGTGNKWSAGAYEALTYVTVKSNTDPASTADYGFDFARDVQGWQNNLRAAVALADDKASIRIGYQLDSVDPFGVTPVFTLVSGQLVSPNGITIDGQIMTQYFYLDGGSTAGNNGQRVLTYNNAGFNANFIYSGGTGGVTILRESNLSGGFNYYYIDIVTGSTVYVNRQTTAAAIVTLVAPGTSGYSAAYNYWTGSGADAANGKTIINEGGTFVYYTSQTDGSYIAMNKAVVAAVNINTSAAPVAIAGSNLTIDAQNTSRAFVFTKISAKTARDITLQNMNIVNTAADNTTYAGAGGAIYSTENLTLNNVTIKHSTAFASGGAIYSIAGNLTLTNVTVGDAAAVSADVISQFGSGGGVYAEAGNLTATNVNIYHAQAAVSGGGIYLKSGTMTLNTVVVANSRAANFGGGVAFDGSSVTVTNSYFNTNVVTDSASSALLGTAGFGGGMYIKASGSVTITTTTFGNNQAGVAGGGIYINGGSTAITNSTIANNMAATNGGGIYFNSTNGLSLTYVTVANNIAGYQQTGAADTQYDGGGIYMNRGTLSMVDTIVAQNFHNTATVEDVATSTKRSDLYLTVSATYGSCTYDIIGAYNRTPSGGWDASNQIMDTVGWGNLLLSTSLMTVNNTAVVYVMNSSIAQGNGLYINPVTGLPYALNDERGVNRATGLAPNGPTIGAYEKMTVTYVLKSNNLDVTVNTNWENAVTLADYLGNFTDLDAVFKVDHSGATIGGIATSWTIGGYASIEVATGGDLTVAGTKTLTLNGGGAITGAGLLVIQGVAIGTLTVGSVSTGNATLELNTSNVNLAGFNYSINASALPNTTVKYTYNGTGSDAQSIKAGTYGNLYIANGAKTFAGDITVQNTLTVENTTVNAATRNITLTRNGGGAADALLVNSATINAGSVIIVDNSGNNRTTLNNATVNVTNGFSTGDSLINNNSAVNATGGNIVVTDDLSFTGTGAHVISASAGSISAGTLTGTAATGTLNMNASGSITSTGAVNLVPGAGTFTGSITSTGAGITFADSLNDTGVNLSANTFVNIAGNAVLSGADITATNGNIILGGNLTMSGNLSATTGSITIAGAADITGNITASGLLSVDGNLKLTNGMAAITNAVTLGSNLTLNVASLTAGSDIIFSSGSATITVIGNGSSAIKTGGVIKNYASVATGPTINVGGATDSSTLTVEFTGANTSIALHDGTEPAGTWSWAYNVDNATVNASSELRFVTTGIAGANIAGGANTIAGTLGITANQIAPLDITLHSASLYLKSREAIELAGLTINGSITFDGNVKLVNNDTVTVTSNNGAVNFTGILDGNGKSLTINAHTYATLNNLSNLVNLTVNSGDIRLDGDIRATGLVTFQAGSPVVLYKTASITAASLSADSFTGHAGTESLTLSIAGGSDLNTSHLMNLTLQGTGTYTAGSISLTGNLTNYATATASGAITLGGALTNSGTLTLNDLSMTGGNITNNANATMTINGAITNAGSLTNSGTLTADGTVTLADSLTNSGAANFNAAVNAGGNMQISGVTTFADDVTVGGTTTISSASITINNGKIMSTGGLTLNAGGSLNVGTGSLNVAGDLNNAGNLVSAGVLNFNGTALQSVSLTGTASLHDVTLNNATGVQLVAGNLAVNNFTFTDGRFNLGSHTVEIDGTLTGGGENSYFIANANGTLRMMARNGLATDFWIGGNYASMVSIINNSADTFFSVQTYGNVTGQGTVNGQTIIGIATAVNRTWVINGPGTYDAAFAWNNAEGPAVGTTAALSTYQIFRWVTVGGSTVSSSGNMNMTGVMPISGSGTFAIAAPGTNYDYPGSFKGLNDNNANSGGFSYPSIAVDVPPSQGAYSFDMMQLYLSESPLGNPLGVAIPGTGTDIGGEYANDFLTITTGRSVYGSPNGENGVNTEWMPEEEREPDPVGEEIDRQLEDFFTELADNSMHEKHPAFKSEVEILLDKLLAS